MTSVYLGSSIYVCTQLVKMFVSNSGAPISVFFGRNDDNTAAPEWFLIIRVPLVHLDVNSALFF